MSIIVVWPMQVNIIELPNNVVHRKMLVFSLYSQHFKLTATFKWYDRNSFDLDSLLWIRTKQKRKKIMIICFSRTWPTASSRDCNMCDMFEWFWLQFMEYLNQLDRFEVKDDCENNKGRKKKQIFYERRVFSCDGLKHTILLVAYLEIIARKSILKYEN